MTTLNISIAQGYMMDVTDWSQDKIDIFVQQLEENTTISDDLNDSDITHYEAVIYQEDE